MSDPVLLTIADGVAEVRFNRPDALNALDFDMASAVAAAVDRALADRATRVILMTGEGRAFMAGGDLAAFKAASDRPAMIATLIEPLHAMLLRLAESPVVTIAAGQGAIAGAGLSVFLSVDLGFLADDAKLTMAYARIGASPDCGGTYSLIRLVGLRKAMEIALLNDVATADEALRLGLANRVFPRAQLLDQARAVAARLASGPAVAQGNIKKLLREAAGRDMQAQLAAEQQSFLALAATSDFGEGLDAFFARRSPQFTGK